MLLYALSEQYITTHAHPVLKWCIYAKSIYKLQRFRGSRTLSCRSSEESFHAVPWYLELWYKTLHSYSVVEGRCRIQQDSVHSFASAPDRTLQNFQLYQKPQHNPLSTCLLYTAYIIKIYQTPRKISFGKAILHFSTRM